ncbi:hypothetical protein L7F22_052173 [Adiantum nelumboides]|nr:hypothetical protein [Adiantum nelumboides]
MASWAVAALLFLLVLVLLIHKALSLFVWGPLRIQKRFRAQGISGPPYRIFFGKPFLFWLGWNARLTLVDPELCKEVLSNKYNQYPKLRLPIQLQDLFAEGLTTLEGEKWAQHRRIVNPAFFSDKLKGMVPTIVNLASTMLEKWKSDSENSTSKETEACKEFQALTADIISHTAFGSSYAEGKQVFLLQYEQQALFLKLAGSVLIPGAWLLPTALNRYRWTLRKQITTTLEGIVKKRLSLPSDAYGSDLLGLMLSALKEEGQKNLTMSLQEIIDECKTFYFAGHETTSSLLTWTVMLLANHSQWQERGREEVFSILGRGHPDADSLNHLKIIGMILQESLWLYPPAVGVFRKTIKDEKLDALEFNPLRFANGVLKACKQPSAFLPFGGGPRICVGQNFAMMEAKIVLSMILQKFRFRVSPGYRHAPIARLTLQPEHGMQILLEPLV